MQSGRLDDAQSSGRVSDTDPQVYYFDKPTPGAANPAVGLKGPAPTPVFSVSSGYLEGGGKVFITCPGATIRYTTDGSAPTASSPVYQGEIAVSKNITIRARAFMDGRLPSEDSAAATWWAAGHAMPVIFLSTDPANLFDYNTWHPRKGSLAIPTPFPPYPARTFGRTGSGRSHFEYVDENGVASWNSTRASRYSGSTAARWIRKACPSTCGIGTAPRSSATPCSGRTPPPTSIPSWLLRNAGQDGSHAHLRDAFVADD